MGLKKALLGFFTFDFLDASSHPATYEAVNTTGTGFKFCSYCNWLDPHATEGLCSPLRVDRCQSGSRRACLDNQMT